MHHYVSSSRFILGSGAELRGSFHRRPLEPPYALIVDTADLANDTTRQPPSGPCIHAVVPAWCCWRECSLRVKVSSLGAHCMLAHALPMLTKVLHCRFTNIQLINTIGVAEADMRKCLVRIHFNLFSKSRPNHCAGTVRRGSYCCVCCAMDSVAKGSPVLEFALKHLHKNFWRGCFAEHY